MGEPPRKKTRTSAPPADDGLSGLYDFLPPPDPAKDAAAKAAAERNLFARPKLPEEDRTRVIFLDVDGVLLPVGSLETVIIDGVPVPVRDTVRESDFSAQALGSLRWIVQHTGASIVLSSEWRRTDKLKSSINAVLKAQEMPGLRDSTEVFTAKPELARQSPVLAWCERRAREIGKWLKDHPEVTSWVALDDLDFAWADAVRSVGTPWVKYRSICTDQLKCLTEEDAALAVRCLIDPPPEPVSIRRPARMTEASGSQTEGKGQIFITTEDSLPERIRLG